MSVPVGSPVQWGPISMEGGGSGQGIRGLYSEVPFPEGRGGTGDPVQ